MSWLSKAFGLDKPQNKATLQTLNAAGAVLEAGVEASSPQAAQLINIAQAIGNGQPGTALVTMTTDQVTKLEASLYNLVTNLGVEIGEQTFDNLVYNTLQQDGVNLGTAAIVAVPAPAAVAAAATPKAPAGQPLPAPAGEQAPKSATPS